MALSDALLTMIMAMATLAIFWLNARPTWPRAILLGGLLGLGASAKLSPLFLALGLALLGVLFLLFPWIRKTRLVARRWQPVEAEQLFKLRRIGLMLLGQPVIAFCTFVLSYPYLWSSPVERTLNLINFRTREMNSQARIWSDRAIDTRWDAIERIWIVFRDTYTSTGRLLERAGEALGRSWGPTGFDQWLGLAGLILFLVLAFRSGVLSDRFLALALLGGQAAAIVVGMRVDFNRYYLPLLLFFAVCVSVLAGVLWSLPALGAAHVRDPGRRSTRASQPSPIVAD
jgi:hypothetical protein